ncbi:MAG TPA: hypothetical protein VKV15_05515 [Bryobacteraceae bacterium]|nr:hypothetical protein [Bryobacteraceae bacterium]
MVIGYAQLLSKTYTGKLEANADQFIGYIVGGGRRLDALLKGMREYWQSSDRGEDYQTTLDGNEVLKMILFNLKETITNDGAVVLYDFS